MWGVTVLCVGCVECMGYAGCGVCGVCRVWGVWSVWGVWGMCGVWSVECGVCGVCGVYYKISAFIVQLHLIPSLTQEEEDIYSKIFELCDAVIHLESSHTRVAVQTPSDKEMILLLSRYSFHNSKRGQFELIMSNLCTL